MLQLTGLSGAGKTSIAYNAKRLLECAYGAEIPVEVIDADEYRKTVSKGLGFSKEDRVENMRRLGKLGHHFSSTGRVVIIAAINPYAMVRTELRNRYFARTIWIKCGLDELIRRDTKGLYRRALAPAADESKIYNLTGINDPFEIPHDADLVIHTDQESLDVSTGRLNAFIIEELGK